MLEKKKGLIFGVANDHSIAWGIAKSLKEQGAEIALTYQNETFLKRVKPLADSIESEILIECDVAEEKNIHNCFNNIKKYWSSIDFIIHAIAYSDKNELSGSYLDTSVDNFLNTLNISCYSLTSISREASKLMTNGGSIVTLSFYGSEKVMPNYNVMGVAKSALETSVKYLSVDLGSQNIRVNAISSGPMRTLSGAAISNAREVYKFAQNNSALKRSVGLNEIGNSAIYLTSDLSSAVTGEVLYVDCGYNIIGMPSVNY
ncbi:MAG: Enoyl-[acyl-carrier-protein] reductase [NADH] FabI [Alphaproteobacteria bacterium MarineAlpha5_Bin11]|nr:enoyl-[acyl-carrier-protein] reductase FabI [Pelagibacteraceae bacterium]PPR45156.1 MAG: Enoyl-[acyl-carrier-protein] reductase [NADH] FabI [Alphaproteobacteria bacterium MarineAlpha5_Bin11]PPR52128.1 MAG: Enoyl-[acyl-carrier-protein] reductase [NADH] FabI [Alphaproteobacteria bacterium MarineAlpha5_Bin10]|tara:strand:- start:31626 stop:32402 length:777 start_codon:yes stop_codon:yes gene_type:complete